ncbi:DEAD/DEAH box helicase family protein [Paenibacillus antarcticus]|uniref:Helicase/UvrB N-terminal domain-containing protein n=1 Tax=Paenibacillus antarcticus TaxID=253703 RepID=A0A168MGI7_9BACL|nr:DEAD/DEAH box helicase family protein [Paenibacillus antarcticus]OAB44648.1 hypothetical protein PBAT_15405 [Paenibacillus antarcticus]
MKNENEDKKVIVLDSIMGSGKTSYAIQLMKEAPNTQRFIYVTPFLDEVKRIKSEVSNRNFREPNAKHGHGTKLASLKKLIATGEDIATTHALFALADDELMELLKWERYTLIVDEVMDVIEQVPLKRDDLPVLLKSGYVEISEDTQAVTWTGDHTMITRFNDVMHYALSGNLYAVNNVAFVWNFPAKVFNYFDEVYILTYLFAGQVQRHYYDFHGVQYAYYDVVRDDGRYELVPKSSVKEDRSRFRELITIYDGKLNDIGVRDTALSKSWFEHKHNTPNVKKLKDAIYNYFRHVTKSKSENFLWTTFKDSKKRLQGCGFAKEESKIADTTTDKGKACFTPFNIRATNKYRHKTVLAFALNRYMNPIEKHFFAQRNVTVNEEMLALSDLLQWLFRSAIRDGQPVKVYVPSRRMRVLLQRWLDNEI